MDWLALALGAATLLGGANFLGGHAARSGIPSTGVALVSHTVGLLCLATIVLVARIPLPPPEALPVMAAGGVASALATILLYRALRLGLMAVNAPVAGVTSILTATLAGVAGGEHLTLLAIVGIIVAVGAIIATSHSNASHPHASVRAGLPEAIGAGVGFGVLSVCLAASTGGAAETLLVTRMVSAALLLGIVARELHGVKVRALVAAGTSVGAFEFTANLLMFSALASGVLAIVQTLLSLNPIVTVLLARAAYHEHLDRRRQLGAAATLASIVLLALG